MTDPNLVRVLTPQTSHRVGLIDYSVVAQGEAAIRARIAALRAQGIAIAIVDAISNDDLLRLGAALSDMPLVTAGSGVAIGLPANFGIRPNEQASCLPPPTGLQAIVSGSCSRATNGQVAAFRSAGLPAIAVDPLKLQQGAAAVERVVADTLIACQAHLAQGPVLVYSTAEPEALKSIQQQLGVQTAGELVEQTLARIAVGLVQQGVGQLIVAGGETSGAVVQALGMTQLQIGAQIDPGVPWCSGQTAVSGKSLHITLKSGNFGAPDFFTKAFEQIA
jgi:uncharacterized protein YgbK (DUF1537 family)